MKILIVSHTPISTDEAMGKTFLSLFDSFKKEELCQFFIHPSMPNIDKCASYFRTTDKDVLKSYFKLFRVNGKKINSSDINISKRSLFENNKDEVFYKNPKNRSSFRVIMRDLIWKFSNWYTRELREWIKAEKPTHIFVAPGNAKLIYDVAIKISKEFNLPIITYICDEFYFVKAGSSFLDKLRLNMIQNKMRKLMQKTSHIITICNSLKDLYSKEFNKPATTIMTGASVERKSEINKRNEIKSLYYMGNIRCDRYLNLIEIGKALKKINQEYNADFTLKVYTNVKNEELIKPLKEIDTIELCGFLVGEEFNRVFNSADVLIHTEAFDEFNINLVKNSVSTKIADSLASGIPLFAYGPAEVASMIHLIDNNCAITAISEEQLYEALIVVLFDIESREKIVANALKIAGKYHDSASNSFRLYSLFESIKN